jgi:hypothetical protein
MVAKSRYSYSIQGCANVWSVCITLRCAAWDVFQCQIYLLAQRKIDPLGISVYSAIFMLLVRSARRCYVGQSQWEIRSSRSLLSFGFVCSLGIMEENAHAPSFVSSPVITVEWFLNCHRSCEIDWLSPLLSVSVRVRCRRRSPGCVNAYNSVLYLSLVIDRWSQFFSWLSLCYSSVVTRTWIVPDSQVNPEHSSTSLFAYMYRGSVMLRRSVMRVPHSKSLSLLCGSSCGLMTALWTCTSSAVLHHYFSVYTYWRVTSQAAMTKLLLC